MTVKDVMVRFSGNASEFKRSAEEVKKKMKLAGGGTEKQQRIVEKLEQSIYINRDYITR